MILSFINIRKVPREMLKTSGFALGLQHLPRNLANAYEWKIMFDPYNIRARVPSSNSKKKTDRFTCHIDSQPTV